MRSRLSLCRCTRNGSSLVRSTLFVLITVTICSGCSDLSNADDHVSRLQAAAIADGKSALGHWGTDSGVYTKWRSHSNRLIPVYTFGTKGGGSNIDLNDYIGPNSVYRSEAAVRRIYGRVPEKTVHGDAVWMDQTNVADIQRAAAAAGRKHIFVVVFDGMDWTTTRLAAIHNEDAVTYSRGRGTGTHFQNYDADGTTQFGLMVTSPHNQGTETDPQTQTVKNPGGNMFGGYDSDSGGAAPWMMPDDASYLLGKPGEGQPTHAYTDSASSATSMFSGIKTYNNAIGVGPGGEQVPSIAHDLQLQGFAVGVVSSVPISHATPAAAYAHNVARKDYQDIARDMLGLPSVAHPGVALPGLDVVIGGGYGQTTDEETTQGDNFEPGNVYLSDADLSKVSVKNGGKYVTAVRTSGKPGKRILKRAALKAAEDDTRLLGFFGVGEYSGHLPFQTADGDYSPVRGYAADPEQYSEADLNENPNLAQMTEAALTVLSSRPKGFWLLVEAGDADWANHDNNIDNSIGAVNSGDAAVKVITDWVDTNSNWQESILIVTADHGHLFQLTYPELLVTPAAAAPDK
ncbi:MAG: alkaline phosphatase [Fuerstiella sp.]|nr:alkaline phosphatase [Fuerstiella sp.]MCP4854770.1 alkaline phosphatase [Fuerstiella sp.]